MAVVERRECTVMQNLLKNLPVSLIPNVWSSEGNVVDFSTTGAPGEGGETLLTSRLQLE